MPTRAATRLRAIGGIWSEMGGQAQRPGARGPRAGRPAQPAFELSSPPLAEVIRDINKYSNNVMAQQLFLTLGLQQKNSGTLEAARAALRQWWNERIGTGEGQPVFDNGSGLSRDERISAAALGRMLQVAWRSPVMPELVSSLPASGVDGTLKRRSLRSGGAAHLKTGSLRDAAGVAGYVRWRQRPALRGGGDRQPRQCRRGAAGLRRAGRLGEPGQLTVSRPP